MFNEIGNNKIYNLFDKSVYNLVTHNGLVSPWAKLKIYFSINANVFLKFFGYWNL